jgi:phosphohistidine phosphatase
MDSEVANERTLVIVRHAKSSWDFDVDDHERPLSARGRRDADALGRLLSQ